LKCNYKYIFLATCFLVLYVNLYSQQIQRKYDFGLKANQGKIQVPERDLDFFNSHAIKFSSNREFVGICTFELDKLARFFSHNKDGLAIEYVTFDNTFSCSENTFDTRKSARNGKSVIDGQLLAPIYTKDILSQIERIKEEEKKKTRKRSSRTDKVCHFIEIAPLPDNYYRTPSEVHLLVIKKKRIVDRVSMQSSCGAFMDYPLPKVPYGKATATVEFYQPSEDVSQVYRIHFGKNSTTPIGNVLDSMKQRVTQSKGFVLHAKIKAYSSIEGSANANERLAAMRAKEIFRQLPWLGEIRFDIEVAENWEAFERDVARSDYAYLTAFSHDSIRSLLRGSPLARKLEPMFTNHRYADVQFELVHTPSLETFCEEQMQLWDTLAANAQISINELSKVLRNIRLVCPDSVASLSYPDAPRVQFELLKYQLDNELVAPDEALFLLQELKGKVEYAEYQRLYSTLIVNHRDVLASEFDFKHVRNVYNYWSSLWQGQKREHLQAFYDFEYVRFIYKMQDQRRMRLAVRMLDNIYETYKHDSLDYTFALNLAKFYQRFEKPEWVEHTLHAYLDNPEYPEASVVYLKTLSRGLSRGEDYLSFVDVLLNAKIYLPDVQWCQLFFDSCGVHYTLLDHEKVRKLYCEFCK